MTKSKYQINYKIKITNKKTCLDLNSAFVSALRYRAFIWHLSFEI